MSGVIQNVASSVGRAAGELVHKGRAALSPSSRMAVAGGQESVDRWLTLTVLRPPAEVDGGLLPPPLAEFGDRIEIRVRPASQDRGSELAVRLRDPGGSDGPSQDDLRSALRRAKQLLEVGEVLVADPIPHGKRTATPGGALLEGATRRAGEEGVL